MIWTYIYGYKWYVKCICDIYKPDGILLAFDSFSIGRIVQVGIKGASACDVGDDEADAPGDVIDDENGFDVVVDNVGDVGR